MQRHDRQARLAGVGPEGQARIGRAVVAVPGHGPSAVLAARYLAGAGVAGVRVADARAGAAARAVDARVRVEVDAALAEAAEVAPPEIHDPVARALAAGALQALASLRAILAS